MEKDQPPETLPLALSHVNGAELLTAHDVLVKAATSGL